jgi:hypothetical protein
MSETPSEGQPPPASLPPDNDPIHHEPPTPFVPPPAGPYPPPPPGNWAPPPPGSRPAGAAPARRSRKGLWIGGAAALVVIALVAAGVLVAVFKFTGGGGAAGGAESPQAAVLNFLAAAQNNDMFAAADLLDPQEQAGVKQVLDNAQHSAQNAGYQQGGGKNGLLEGLRITTDNVQTSVTTLRDDLARVSFTGGQITLGFDPDHSNPGLRDLFSKDQAHQHTWTAGDLQTRSNLGGVVQPEAMTVRRTGRWYISLLYTFFDMSALKQGKAPVDPGNVGTQAFPSAEAAARGFVNGLVSTLTSADITPVAQSLSPDEGALLTTYRPLFSEMRSQSLQVIGTPQFSATSTGADTANVKVNDLELLHTDSGGDTKRIAIQDTCIQEGNQNRCDFSGANVMQSLIFSPRSTGFIATKGQNGWHIDPVATYLNAIAATLHDSSKEQVAALLAGFGAPRAFLSVKAEAQLNDGDEKAFTLTRSTGQGPAVAVFDLPVNAGQELAVTVQASSPNHPADYSVRWLIVGESGTLVRGGGIFIGRFTAPDTETAKLAVWGPPDERVAVTVRS